MPEIVEVIHELSYKVTGAENIKQVADQMQRNVDGIDRLKQKLTSLQGAYKSTQDVNEQQRLSNAILKTKRAIDDATVAASKQVSQSKVVQNAVQKEIGIIESLQDKLTDLKKAREAATDVKDINSINAALRQTQVELSKLTDIDTGGGLAALFGVGSATTTGKQVLQGALSGLGIGVGFSVIPALTSSLVEFLKVEYDVNAKTIEFAGNVETLRSELGKLGDIISKIAEDRQLLNIGTGLNNISQGVLAIPGSIIEDAYDKTTEGVKRTEAAIKALGVVQGEVYQQELRDLNALQDTRRSELKDINRRQEAYKQFADLIKTQRQIIGSSLNGGAGPAANVTTAIANSFDALGIAPLDRDKIRAELKESEGDVIQYQLALDRINKEYIVKAGQAQQDALNKQNEIETSQIEFVAKRNENIYQLNLKLINEINDAQNKFSQEQISRQEKTVDTIVNSINVERNARERALSLREEEARKQLGTIPTDIQAQFNTERKQIEQAADADIIAAKKKFYQEQLQLAETFNQRQIQGEIAGAKQRLTEVSATELTTNLDIRKEIIDKELQLQLSGISQEFTNQTAALEKLQAERRERGQQETQEYKLTQDQLTEIFQSAAARQEDALRASNIRKLTAYADYYKQVIALTELQRQQLQSSLEVQNSQERLDIETGNGGLFGRSFQRRIQGFNEQAEQAEINRNASLQDLDVAADRLRKANEELNKASADTRNAAQLEVDAAQAAFDMLTTNINNAEAKQIQAVRNARLAEVNAYLDSYQQITTQATLFYNQMNEYRQNDLQREISVREQRVDVALELAERGNTAALDMEQKRLDAANEAYRKNALEQQSINAGLALSNAIVGVSKAAAEGGVLAPATIATFLAALGAGYFAVKSITQASQTTGFWKGGYTGDGGKFDEAGPVHKGEFVFDKETTAKYRPIFEKIHETGMFPAMAPQKYGMVLSPTANQRGLEKRLDTIADRLDTLQVNQYIGENGIYQNVKQSARKIDRRYLD